MGSSSSRTSGLVAITAARATFFFSPPLSLKGGRSLERLDAEQFEDLPDPLPISGSLIPI